MSGRHGLRIALALLLATASQAEPRTSNDIPPKARQWMRTLTLRQKVAQLVMIPFYGDIPNPRTKAYKEFSALVADTGVGGMIILNRVRNGAAVRAEPFAMAAFLNHMQRLAKLPLIVGGDFERGASMRMMSTAPFPHAMAFGATGDPALTRELGRATARESRAMGVHWVFAPDADVNNNPDNPVINIRSFGEDPKAVSAHVRAFIEGAHSDPSHQVLVTVKHFPGHGDTAVDSHLGLGTVTASKDRLDRIELVPFRDAIAAGVDSVMTAHVSVPALEPDAIPATVSRKILTGLLRDELGFKGLLTTDALDMQGVTKLFAPGEAAVRALEAGADLLLIPQDPRKAIEGVMQALASGRLTKERIDYSLGKLLSAKLRVGLDRNRYVNLEELNGYINTPEDIDLADRTAAKALTLVRNEGAVLPLKHPISTCFFLMPALRFSTQGRDLEDELDESIPEARVELLDPLLPLRDFDDYAADAAKCDTVVLIAYALSATYRGGAPLPGNYPAFVDKVLATKTPVVLVSLGNPYLLRAYPQVQGYIAGYSTVAPIEDALAKALLGKAPFSGKLPVSIPGIAVIGDGISLPAKQ